MVAALRSCQPFCHRTSPGAIGTRGRRRRVLHYDRSLRRNGRLLVPRLQAQFAVAAVFAEWQRGSAVRLALGFDAEAPALAAAGAGVATELEAVLGHRDADIEHPAHKRRDQALELASLISSWRICLSRCCLAISFESRVTLKIRSRVDPARARAWQGPREGRRATRPHRQRAQSRERRETPRRQLESG